MRFRPFAGCERGGVVPKGKIPAYRVRTLWGGEVSLGFHG